MTDRDLGLGLGLGRDCLLGGISVLGRDSSNLGREPRHNKLLYFSNFYYGIEKLSSFCNHNLAKKWHFGFKVGNQARLSIDTMIFVTYPLNLVDFELKCALLSRSRSRPRSRYFPHLGLGLGRTEIDTVRSFTSPMDFWLSEFSLKLFMFHCFNL